MFTTRGVRASTSNICCAHVVVDFLASSWISGTAGRELYQRLAEIANGKRDKTAHAMIPRVSFIFSLFVNRLYFSSDLRLDLGLFRWLSSSRRYSSSILNHQTLSCLHHRGKYVSVTPRLCYTTRDSRFNISLSSYVM